ncbi:hypothetical protein AB0I72_10795 [Nocardiopsis sp. NPDC049922]|uniref:hypothetical protein n=1 Tax=Nocardiopsis sp. NPDC049922 TaxID=3155157 RepID=UPI0033CDDA9E
MSEPPEPPARRRISRERWILVGAVAAIFAAFTSLRVTSWGGLDQTAFLYVGLPALIALAVAFYAKPRTAVGLGLVVTTLALALSGPLLGEGLVCLLIAAPLMLGIVALVITIFRAIARGGRGSQQALLAVPLLFVLALEGVGGTAILPRADQGTGSAWTDVRPQRVAEALAAPPEYAEPDALLLRAVPFPLPVEAVGEGLAVGDTRTVHFTPGQSLGIGAEPVPRHMELEITESEIRPDGGRVVFTVVEDTTLARWMDVHRAEARWSAEGGGTRITWTMDFDRTYEPSWYFGPLQSHTVDLAAAYLADTFASAAPGEEDR